jgi:hypothetical protein
MGGQEQFREEYMQKPEVFKGTDILIPVVSLHEPGTFEEARDYFKDLLELYRKNNEKPRIFLFLHKYDTERIDN